MATQEIFSGAEAQERLKQLPPEIRSLIYSADMTNIIRSIGSAHDLHIDQIGTLEAETSFLMLGFTAEKDFAHVLAGRLGVEERVGEQLALEVHDKILVKIRAALHTLYPDNIDPVSGTTAATPHEKAPLATRHTPSTQPKATQFAYPPEKSTAAATPHVDPIEAALSAVQKQPAQTSVVSTSPASKPTSYGTDPYLEPIE